MRVIAGSARSLPLKTVPGMNVRPTTDRIKETLFNILSPYIPGARFLDLFSGSGAIGIEALSRGAREAVFVEKDRRALDCIRENLRFTKLTENACVIPSDVFQALKSLPEEAQPFDLIFMDPPYSRGLEGEVLRLLRTLPAADENTLVIVEADLETVLPDAAECGFSVTREKRYKTNKHVFLRRSDR